MANFFDSQTVKKATKEKSNVQGLKELTKEAGITDDQLDAARSTESVFLHYLIHGRPLFVEVIAPNLVETLLQLLYDDQTKFMMVILNLVPEIGDQEVIVDDHGDGKKSRGSRVNRMKSERDEFINLLITGHRWTFSSLWL